MYKYLNNSTSDINNNYSYDNSSNRRNAILTARGYATRDLPVRLKPVSNAASSRSKSLWQGVFFSCDSE